MLWWILEAIRYPWHFTSPWPLTLRTILVFQLKSPTGSHTSNITLLIHHACSKHHSYPFTFCLSCDVYPLVCWSAFCHAVINEYWLTLWEVTAACSVVFPQENVITHITGKCQYIQRTRFTALYFKTSLIRQYKMAHSATKKWHKQQENYQHQNIHNMLHLYNKPCCIDQSAETSLSVTHWNSRLYLQNVSPCTNSEMTEN